MPAVDKAVYPMRRSTRFTAPPDKLLAAWQREQASPTCTRPFKPRPVTAPEPRVVVRLRFESPSHSWSWKGGFVLVAGHRDACTPESIRAATHTRVVRTAPSRAHPSLHHQDPRANRARIPRDSCASVRVARHPRQPKPEGVERSRGVIKHSRDTNPAAAWKATCGPRACTLRPALAGQPVSVRPRSLGKTAAGQVGRRPGATTPIALVTRRNWSLGTSSPPTAGDAAVTRFPALFDYY